jgi:hypothetical protein
MTLGNMPEQASFLQHALALKRRSALKAIAAGYLADQFTPPTIRKDAVQIFARNAGHSGEVGLFDLLTDHNAILANALAEVLGEFEERHRDSAAQWQKALSRDDIVGVSQT